MTIFKNLKKFSQNIAAIDENLNKITYNELIKNSKLIQKLISPQEVVFLVCENSIDFLKLYVGLIQNKNIIYLIENTMKKNFLEKILKLHKPNYIFFPSNFELKKKKNSQRLFSRYLYYKLIKKKIYNLDKRIAILLSTSGTTGSSKFVKLSLQNIEDNAIKISSYLNINKKSITVTTMQPSYSYGMSIINSHLIKGGAILFTDKTIFEKNFWQLMEKIKITNINGVPFIFEMLKKIKFENFKLQNLKFVTQAGGRLEPNIINHFIKIFKKKKIKFFLMYGQTEASPRMSFIEITSSTSKIESIGKAIKGGKFFIYDEKNKLIKKENIIGELAYKGKNVMIGYATKFEDLKMKKQKDILFTGDMAYRDKEGFFYITGRKKRFIKLYGHRINLDDIEKSINKRGFKVAIKSKNEKLIIYLENQYINRKIEIQNFLKKNFKINERNYLINLIKKIPINNRGKIDYSNLV